MSTQRPSLSTLSVRERMELWKQREKAAMNKVLSTPESIASSKAQKRAVAITNRMSTTRMSATMRSSGANRNSFTQRNSMAVMGRASTALQGHMESISEAFITGEAEYPTLGVKLPFLLEFIKSNGGRTNLSTFTVKDVQDRIIKLELAKNASIKATGLTYCDIVAKRTPDHVEPSTWYVSCSENDNFLQVIDAIIYTLNQNLLEEDNQRACVWMNIFSLPLQDAHIYMRNQEWWESKMLKAIESVENFLLVLTPLSSALSLTSPTVWNEVLCCYKTNVKFEIAMTEADSSTYLDRVLGFNGIQHLFKPLESITSKHLFESKQGGADIVIRAVENNLKSLELTSTASAISKGNQSKLDYIAKTLIQSRLIRLYLDSMDEPTEATLQVLNQFQSENFTHFNTNIMDTALVSFGGMFQMCFTSLELRYNIRPNSDFSEAKMESLIHKEIQNIKLCLKHPVSDIRDTAAWTIATLFQYDIFAIPPVHLTDIMTILAENLKDSASSVIAKTCYALHSFCAMLLEASPATVKILNIYIIPRNNDIWDILSTEAATDSLLQYNVCQLLKMIVSKTDLWTHREFVLDTMSRSVLKMHQCFRDEESGSVAMEDVTLLMHMCELIGECVVKLHRSMDYAAGGYLRSIPPAMGVLFLVLEFSKKFKQSKIFISICAYAYVYPHVYVYVYVYAYCHT